MVAQTWSVAFAGTKSLAVEVQVSALPGLASFTIVGLADKSVAESRERIRAALAAAGLDLPNKRLVVNLAPADLQKEGGHYDLPIALALMAEIGLVQSGFLEGVTALGELGLDGSVAYVPGVLPAAFHAREAGRKLIAPAVCAHEVSRVADSEWLAAESLSGLLAFFVKQMRSKNKPSESTPDDESSSLPPTHTFTRIPPLPPVVEDSSADAQSHSRALRQAGLRDLTEVKGQDKARFALEMAAAGGHNLLFIGPPGAGKSLLAECLPGILPALSATESLEVETIYSLAGVNVGSVKGQTAEMRRDSLQSRSTQTQAHRRPPFRAPHHSASLAALAGGGARARPGEVSLAHRGVLFLDELPEFSRATLETLRQPLESGEITVSRAAAHMTYPASVQLVAAMNPCRCGFAADPGNRCRRFPRCVEDYNARISGPFLDRVDIYIEVAAVPPATLARMQGGEASASVASRVRVARTFAACRAARLGLPPLANAALTGSDLEQAAQPTPAAQTLLERAALHHELSARGWNRVLRLARTAADLQEQEELGEEAIATAIELHSATRSPLRGPLRAPLRGGVNAKR